MLPVDVGSHLAHNWVFMPALLPVTTIAAIAIVHAAQLLPSPISQGKKRRLDFQITTQLEEPKKFKAWALENQDCCGIEGCSNHSSSYDHSEYEICWYHYSCADWSHVLASGAALQDKATFRERGSGVRMFRDSRSMHRDLGL